MDTETSGTEAKPAKIQFKGIKKKPLRRRVEEDSNSGDEEQAAETLAKLAETKELQKIRNKPNGISLVGLAIGKKVTIEEEILIKDPFNAKNGGMVNMQSLKSGKLKQVDDAYDVGIGTQFSAETNKRDEDEEMMKYIEDQLKKRKGVITDNPEDGDQMHKYLSPEEAALLAVPEHLRQSSSQRSEEMLSNQMLNGIPEVDLGIDAKIKNIEATEEAKQRMLQEQKNKKDGPSQFVPTNMAVNFVQHNRFNIDEALAKKRKYPQREEHDKEKGPKKATDDYHFDRFKKLYRR